MEYLRIAPDIDTDPGIEEAGWAAARVYELLLKVSALKDLRGDIPPEFQKPSWLAKRWNLGANDIPGVTPEAFIAAGLTRLLQVGKVEMDGQTLIIRGWAKFYAAKDHSTNRVQKFREKTKRSETDETLETEETEETPTPPTPPTPHHSTNSTPQPTTGAAAVEKFDSVPVDQLPDTSDGFWEWIRRTRPTKGLAVEDKRPKDFDAWFKKARGEHDIGDLCDAYLRFLADAWAATKDHATAVFIRPGVWPSRIRRSAS